MDFIGFQLLAFAQGVFVSFRGILMPCSMWILPQAEAACLLLPRTGLIDKCAGSMRGRKKLIIIHENSSLIEPKELQTTHSGRQFLHNKIGAKLIYGRISKDR